MKNISASNSFLRILLTALLIAVVKIAGATTQIVNVQNFSFTPSSFTINVGDTVKWVWVNGTHTTTNQTIPAGAATWNHNINSSAGNTSFIYVPSVTGTYNYNCTIHPTTMLGSFTVNCGTPAVTISAGGATTFCSGGSVVLSKSSATNYTSYQWKKDGGTIAGQTTTSTTATAAGSYTLVATNSCGSTGTSNAIAVTVNSAPSAADATISPSGATTFCSGGSVTLSVATAGLTYSWSTGAATQSITVSTSGTYSCTVSNSCGSIGSNSIVVTVNTAPSAGDATITADGPTTFCKGGSLNLTVATAGLTYQWKKGSMAVSGATQQSYSPTKTATYKCDVSNSCGTTTSNSISVTVNDAPTSTVTQGTCSGGAILLTCTPTPATGISFQWMKGANNLAGQTNSTYSATANATYKCTVTITATGCSKTSKGSKVTITCKAGADLNQNSGVLVYPNPSSEYFNLNTSSLDPQAVIYICDLTGRVVETHNISGGNMQLGESLSNGVYFLKIVLNNQTQQVIKLVKNS